MSFKILTLAATLLFSSAHMACATTKDSRTAALPTYRTDPDDFFYAQQTSLWIVYKIKRDVIQKELGQHLDALGLDLASFEEPEFGYMILKPMVFMAEFGYQTPSIPGTSASGEVELTVLVTPKAQTENNTDTIQDFINGRSTRRNVGQLRLDVLCDHEVAVAAGRAKFGEHKYLGSFEYSYPTANNNLGEAKPFALDMTASTYQGAGKPTQRMFRIQVSMDGLVSRGAAFSPELLYSSFPPEPVAGTKTQTVGEHRYYDQRNFLVTNADQKPIKVDLTFGPAQGATPLAPVAPFGDNKPIAGSESWPSDMVEKMQNTLPLGTVVGLILYQTPPAEYETKPFAVSAQ